MRVHAWLVPGTWQSVVDAVAARPADDQLTLLTVADRDETIPTGMFGQLMGRGRPVADPSTDRLGAEAAQRLLDEATRRLGRPCEQRLLTGRTERVVTAACDDADLLLLARDGDRSRLGPKSMGHHTRFVLDHAPCTVALLWPGEVPSLDSIPTPPPDGHHPPRH